MKEKQISYRFNQFKKGNPFVGHYILLSSAIRGMKYPKYKVSEAFNRLVPKSDYASDERDSLLENLWKVSNANETNEFPVFLSQTVA